MLQYLKQLHFLMIYHIDGWISIRHCKAHKPCDTCPVRKYQDFCNRF